jgi:hypothetical protein
VRRVVHQLLNTERFSNIKDKLKDFTNDGRMLPMGDSEIEYGVDVGLFSVNQTTRGISWQIPKLDEWTRSKDYLINAATWRANQILGRGIDLNIKADVEKNKEKPSDLDIVEKMQSYLKEELFNPLFIMLFLGYFHGGSAGLLIIKNQTDEKSLLRPLTADSIKLGDFLGIKPLTRLYNIQPCYEPQTLDGVKQDVMITKVGADVGIYDAYEFGRPQYYRVSLNADLYGDGELTKRQISRATNFIVHRSHLLIYNSSPLSYIEERIEQFFGPGIGEKAYVAMRRYENLVDQISLLMDRTNVPVLTTKDLAKATMQGSEFQADAAERLEGVEATIAYGNTVVLNEDESFVFANSSFTDIPKLLTEYKKQLVSGISAPGSVTIGQYEANDEHSFDDSIEADSERFLRSWYKTLIPIVYRSLNAEKIKDYSFTFKSLQKQTEEEKAKTLKLAMEIISIAWKDEVLNEPSYHRMMISAAHNISDMLSELDNAYMEHVKQEEKDGKFITYSTKREELAIALNRQAAYNKEGSQ